VAALERTTDMIAKAVLLEWLTREEKLLYQTVMDYLKQYKKSCYSAIDLARSDLNYATVYMGTADEEFQVLNGSLNDLLNLENKLSQHRYDSSLRGFSAELKVFILVSGVGKSVDFS
jgi:hypothetical protein